MVTATEESKADLPISLVGAGTEKRRKLIILRLTTATASETYDISGTVEPNSADIEGFLWCTAADAGTTVPAWSTNVITFNGAAAWEIGVIVNLT